MKLQMMGIALVAGLLAQEAAYAADMGQLSVTRATRVTRMTPIVPERAIARLADQDLGYSVLHEPIGVVPQQIPMPFGCQVSRQNLPLLVPQGAPSGLRFRLQAVGTSPSAGLLAFSGAIDASVH